MNVLKKEVFYNKGGAKKRRIDVANFTVTNPRTIPMILPRTPLSTTATSTSAGSSRTTGTHDSREQITTTSNSFQFADQLAQRSFSESSEEFQRLMEPFVVQKTDSPNTSTEDLSKIISRSQVQRESPTLFMTRKRERQDSISDALRVLHGTPTISSSQLSSGVEDTSVPDKEPPKFTHRIEVADHVFRTPVRPAKNISSSISSIRSNSASISSTKKTPKMTDPRTPKTPKTNSASRNVLSESDVSLCIIAVTEGRGQARGEVGIAAMDPRRPHLILCQISDTQRYVHSLAKMNYFNFVEALVPNTFVEGPAPRKLYLDMLERFPAVTMNQVQRRHFSETNGLQLIQQYCSQECDSVMIAVKDKFYALSAASALLKYIEYTHNIMIAPRSLNVEFQTTEGALLIDMDTASRLELVMGLSSRDEAYSLLGVLKSCRTKGGIRLLRANLLQPFASLEKIQSRLECVTELIQNPLLFNAVEGVISKLTNAENLLALCMHPPQQTGLKAAEFQLKYTLLLKATLDLIPSLSTALQEANTEYFKYVRENLGDIRFRRVLERILLTVEDNSSSSRKAIPVNQFQACFMIKHGINGLLDIAKKTYCEISQEIADLINQLKSKHNLPIRLGVSQNKGYHIQLSTTEELPSKLPEEFILVQKSKNSLTCYTNDLVALDQRCQQALNEIKIMTNVLLFELLNDIRDDIACLFPFCEYIAELDVCIALAHVGCTQNYVRPVFGEKLCLRSARHPVLDVKAHERCIPNDIMMDSGNNFVILTGPNQSGKSICIRQVALLQIMAQIGSYVPAQDAYFRIMDRIFSRLGFDDNIESNASTLMVEMQDMEFIRRNMTDSSLVIVDELCRGTSVEEGTCIAFAIAEQLLDTSAYVFFTTHFLFLTKLQDMYSNVRNFHFETNLNSEAKPTVSFTHCMKPGVTPTENYGLRLAEMMGFPNSVLENARNQAQILRSERKPRFTVCDIVSRYMIAKEMLHQIPGPNPTWQQMEPVIQLHLDNYRKLPPEPAPLAKFLEDENANFAEVRNAATKVSVPSTAPPIEKPEEEVLESDKTCNSHVRNEHREELINEICDIGAVEAAMAELTVQSQTIEITQNTKITLNLNDNKENIDPSHHSGNPKPTRKRRSKSENHPPNIPQDEICTKKVTDVQSIIHDANECLSQVTDKSEYYKWKYGNSPNALLAVAVASRPNNDSQNHGDTSEVNDGVAQDEVDQPKDE